VVCVFVRAKQGFEAENREFPSVATSAVEYEKLDFQHWKKKRYSPHQYPPLGILAALLFLFLSFLPSLRSSLYSAQCEPRGAIHCNAQRACRASYAGGTSLSRRFQCRSVSILRVLLRRLASSASWPVTFPSRRGSRAVFVLSRSAKLRLHRAVAVSGTILVILHGDVRRSRMTPPLAPTGESASVNTILEFIDGENQPDIRAEPATVLPDLGAEGTPVARSMSCNAAESSAARETHPC